MKLNHHSNLFLVLLVSHFSAFTHSSSSKSILVQDLINKLNTGDFSETSLHQASLALRSVAPAQREAKFPIVINTWNFVNATAKAWDNLARYDDAVAAVVNGCSECEMERCDGTVGKSDPATRQSFQNQKINI